LILADNTLSENQARINNIHFANVTFCKFTAGIAFWRTRRDPLATEFSLQGFHCDTLPAYFGCITADGIHKFKQSIWP
jgi:hypothetical protein